MFLTAITTWQSIATRLSIRREIYLEARGCVADSYHSLGIIYRDIEEQDQAREFFEKERIISRKICCN